MLLLTCYLSIFISSAGLSSLFCNVEYTTLGTLNLNVGGMGPPNSLDVATSTGAWLPLVWMAENRDLIPWLHLWGMSG